MKKFYYIFAILMISACSNLKKAEKSMNAGDYVQAFDLLFNEYQKGLSDKNRDRLLPTFQKAYRNMVQAEERRIETLRAAKNPSYYGDIYETLVNLNHRQEQLRRVLPIFHNGKEMVFATKNYQPAILDAKNKYIQQLYLTGTQKINSNDKKDIRNAYNDLRKIHQLSPGYLDVENLMEYAHNKGTEYILIQIENRSNQILPRRLEQDLTQFDAYGLDNFWTEFHPTQQANFNYDYLIRLDIEQILISPERVNTQRHDFQREIVDGWEYLYENGRQVLDSLGKPIRVDKYKTVSARVEESIQEKDALVQGRAELINLENQQIIDRQRLHSEFTFRNHFAQYFGDIKALDNHMQRLIRQRPVPFPSNEQMVYDCGEELKTQLRRMLSRRF